MAEEAQYGTDSLTNKRKYEDQTTTPPRRSTGFSAAIPSPDNAPPPPASYNSVPPPMGEFEIAKQRAQEIAARIFNSAEAKRPRVENNGGSGFDSIDSKGFICFPSLPVSCSSLVWNLTNFETFLKLACLWDELGSNVL